MDSTRFVGGAPAKFASVSLPTTPNGSLLPETQLSEMNFSLMELVTMNYTIAPLTVEEWCVGKETTLVFALD